MPQGGGPHPIMSRSHSGTGRCRSQVIVGQAGGFRLTRFPLLSPGLPGARGRFQAVAGPLAGRGGFARRALFGSLKRADSGRRRPRATRRARPCRARESQRQAMESRLDPAHQSATQSRARPGPRPTGTTVRIPAPLPGGHKQQPLRGHAVTGPFRLGARKAAIPQSRMQWLDISIRPRRFTSPPSGLPRLVRRAARDRPACPFDSRSQFRISSWVMRQRGSRLQVTWRSIIPAAANVRSRNRFSRRSN